MITTRISVDFARPNRLRNIESPVEAMQGDGATRTVAVSLLANGLRWEPPAGVDAALVYRQTDGPKGIYDKLADGSPAITVSGNVASVVLIPQMLAVPGEVQCQLIFNDSKLDRLTSFPFVLKVEKNDVAGAQPVQDYVRLQWLEDKLDEYLRKAAESGEFHGEKGDPGPQGPRGEPGVSTTVNGKTPDETGNVTLTAVDVGALPSSGGDMTGAINMNGQSISGLNPPTEDTQAANKGYVDGVVRKAAPRNLLDNSDFRNPVNQREQTSYSSVGWGYCIDRWMTYSSTATITESGLEISGSSRNVIGQRFSLDYLKKNPEDYVFVYCDANDVVHFSDHKYKYDNFWEFWIECGETTVIKWAALYEGSFTVETLPEYHSKGYENELLVCRQYDPLTGEYIGLRKFGQPRNLLDNSDFRNPVNQRGQTSYTGGYGIDRWRVWDSDTLTVSSGYITSNGYVFQYFMPSAFRNRNHTLVAKKTDGNILLIAKNPHDAFYFSDNGLGLGLDAEKVVIALPAGSYLWTALYEGEYTSETLPEYQPKGYGAELSECMRYYQIRSTDNVLAVDMRPTMRLNNPTITSVTDGYAYSADL